MESDISDNAMQACILATSIECDVDEENVKMVVGAMALCMSKVDEPNDLYISQSIIATSKTLGIDIPDVMEIMGKFINNIEKKKKGLSLC